MLNKQARTDDMANVFLDLEADVDEEESEEEEEEEEDPFIVEDEADDAIRPMNFEREYGDLANEKGLEAETIAATFERRSRVEREFRDVVYWVVPVRVGKESNMAIVLKEKLPNFLGAIGVPWCKGRVYVTAPKTVDAVTLIKHYARNVDGAYVHRQIVPLSAEEQADLDQFLKDRTDFNKRHALHSWVRIRRGVFAGDIAHVHKVELDSDLVELLVVPRFWDGKKRTRTGSQEGRAPQTLFKPMEMVKTIEEGILRAGPVQGSWILNDSEHYFANGLRSLKVTGVHFVEPCRPRAEELELFSLAGINTLGETNDAFLRLGDRVSFVMGLLAGLEGNVVDKAGDSVKVLVREGSEVFEEKTFDAGISEVKRVFKVGDNIRVAMGAARNLRGLVVSVTEDWLTFIDSETREQVFVLHAFVESGDAELRRRVIPTLSAMKEHAMMVPGRKHIALGKLVYVIPEARFGRVIGVKECGTLFRVEGKKTGERERGFNARQLRGISDGGIRDGEEEGEIVEGRIQAGKEEKEFFDNLKYGVAEKGRYWGASQLLATDVWMKLDNGLYERTEEVKKLFKLYVEHQETPEVKQTYIETLRTSAHPVFVSAGRYKTFGSFIGTNGKGHAIMFMENTGEKIVLEAHNVISMLTLRRLDGSNAGNVKAIRERWLKNMGKERGKGRKKQSNRDFWKGGEKERTSHARIHCKCDTPHEANPCAFMLQTKFKELVATHHVMLRFRAGCKEPRNVDGKLAWTTQETDIRHGGCEVRVTYKTKDNPLPRDEFVPLASLEPCTPALKEDEALVIGPENKWDIVYPSHTGKDGSGAKSVMYCKLRANGKKKDAQPFQIKQLTRLRELSKGPPVG